MEFSRPAGKEDLPDDALEGYYVYQFAGIAEVAKNGELWLLSGGMTIILI